MKISELKGLGPKKEQALNKRDIYTPWDLVRRYPADYEDRTKVVPIALLQEGQKALIKGMVMDVKNSARWGKKQLLKVTVADDSASVELVFFNGYYLHRSFHIGDVFYVFGACSFNQTKKQMIHPEFFKEGEGAEKEMGIIPVYSAIKGITQKDMRSFNEQILMSDELDEITEEYLPQFFVEKYGIPTAKEALLKVHMPESFEDVDLARKRFLYEEMLLLRLGLTLLKKVEEKGIVFNKDNSHEEYIKALPYTLTGAQQRTIKDIVNDMESPKVMNRLVQGDVGSGKTAVAEVALYKAFKSGYQGAFMMPTEILAKQQYEGLKKNFEPFGAHVGLLIGSMTAKEKKTVKEQLISGEIDIIVGTHALIQSSVEYKKLGLVVTDEQHRFGVKQRSAIKNKGDNPDCLVMSATPIPRTLSMVLFGDMDISAIDELPAGRMPIRTKAVTGKSRDQVYAFVKEEIDNRHQAYVVAPLIEESEALENVRSATEVYEDLVKRFRNYKVELLHGEMKPEEKAEIMDAFAKGQVDILVSTVVIEVGINVPNATVMVIENSERFGLSQLHQLRGRVGRGSAQSYCILITESLGEVALERAKTMTETNDGFVIAEKDLELRGPGEFFGTNQHGIPSSHIFNLINNMNVYNELEEDAAKILAMHPGLEDDETAKLKGEVMHIFGQDLGTTL